jgi:hypothetical protein
LRHQEWCAVSVDVVPDCFHVLDGWHRVLVASEVSCREEPDFLSILGGIVTLTVLVFLVRSLRSERLIGVRLG